MAPNTVRNREKTTMKKIAMTVSAMALLLAFGLAGTAHAGGAYIGTGIGYSFPSFDLNYDVDIDEQGGFTWEILHGGYNFTDNLGLSLVWGGATGTGEFYSRDLDYSIGYVDLNFRYTYPMEKLSPYGELGLGNYAFVSESSDYDFESSEANLGYRAAVGAMIPIGKFYVAPEFSYHWVEMGEVDVNGDDYNWELGQTDFGLFLLKAGYSFGG